MSLSPALFSALSAAVFVVGLGTAGADPSRQSVLLEGVPHIHQKPDFCGEACVAMYLQHRGSGADQDAVFDLTGVDPTEGRGAYTPELASALKALGITPGLVWHEVDAQRPRPGLELIWQDLLRDLTRGVPSLVCMHFDSQPDATEHFRLILGYDHQRDQVIYHEPADAQGAYQRMPREQFLALWPLKYEKDRWTVIRFALQGRRLKTVRPSATRTGADYAQHILALRKTLPKGFTVVVREPFVIIGDEAPAMVARRAKKTVTWAVKHLEKSYFERPPKDILNIWLFRDEKSYRTNAKRLLGHTPDTPYGYYSPSAKALVMNIATGGGTLVHEIVHPYMEANFPDVPAWFNEGLGALYEQSSERDGRIVGLTNWRLAGLQKLIRSGDLPSFKTLMSTTERQFYREDTGDNYAQARYLLYALQERGLLREYFHAFLRNRRVDPTGYETLKQVLGVTDLAAFRATWEKETLALTFQ